MEGTMRVTRDFMEESNMRTTPSRPPVTRVRPSAEKSREHMTGSPGMPKVCVFLKDRVFQRDSRHPGSPEPLAASAAHTKVASEGLHARSATSVKGGSSLI